MNLKRARRVGGGEEGEGLERGDGVGGGGEEADLVAREVSFRLVSIICSSGLARKFKGYILPAVPLEAKVLGANDAIGDPDLAHVMGFCGNGVAVDDVLDGQGKDLAGSVTGEGGRWLAWENKHDRPGDVAHDIGRDPAVVLAGVLVGLVCFGGLDLALRIVIFRGAFDSIGALPLLGLLFAFECEWFYHSDSVCYGVNVDGFESGKHSQCVTVDDGVDDSWLSIRVGVSTNIAVSALGPAIHYPNGPLSSSTCRVQQVEL